MKKLIHLICSIMVDGYGQASEVAILPKEFFKTAVIIY